MRHSNELHYELDKATNWRSELSALYDDDNAAGGANSDFVRILRQLNVNGDYDIGDGIIVDAVSKRAKGAADDECSFMLMSLDDSLNIADVPFFSRIVTSPDVVKSTNDLYLVVIRDGKLSVQHAASVYGDSNQRSYMFGNLAIQTKQYRGPSRASPHVEAKILPSIYRAPATDLVLQHESLLVDAKFVEKQF